MSWMQSGRPRDQPDGNILTLLVATLHITALEMCPVFSKHGCCRIWEGNAQRPFFYTDSVNSAASPLLRATDSVKEWDFLSCS